MSYFEIFILALALSIDACIVSFTCGLKFNNKHFKNLISLALTTGFFQALMPFIGYYLTNFVKTYIEPYANIIVFLIFTYLGIKFIIEANKNKTDEKISIDVKNLFLIGIATSIDAFSAGISLSLFGNKILKLAILIGFVTFINSCLGYFAGKKLKAFSTKLLEISAGILLILLGIKALF